MQRGEVEDGEYAYGSYLISRWRWWAWRMVTWCMVKKMNIMTWILIYMVPLVLPQFKCSSNTTLVVLNQYIHMHYSFFHILTTYPFLVVQTNVFVTVFLSHPHSRKLAHFLTMNSCDPKTYPNIWHPTSPSHLSYFIQFIGPSLSTAPFFFKPKPCISTVSRVLSFGYV